jgi:hypothetical protein
MIDSICVVMPGLVPGVHVFYAGERRGWPAKASEATPLFERLCPAMTLWMIYVFPS